ncbi:CoA transferase, partial [Planococcus citreus]
KDGSAKIKKACELPLTGKAVVNLIITERAVIEVTDTGLVLKEVFEGFSVDDVVAATDAELNTDSVKVH